VGAKTILRDVLIGGIAPLADAAYRERPRVRVLAFHDTPADRERRFRERLVWLRDRSAIVPLSNAFDRVGLDAARPNIVLTFDDGLKEHHAVAARVLDDLGLSGTFFVPTGAIDLTGAAAAEFSRAGLLRSRTFEFLSSREVRELGDHPSFEIGGHTHSHRPLSGTEDLVAELATPKEVLAQKTGRSVQWFAYPFGSPSHLSVRSAKAVQAAGYRTAFTIVPGFWSVRDHPFILGRASLSLDDSTTSWQGFLRGGYDALSELKYRRTLGRVRRELARPPG
jgi:peptidoglycan/xylan/chitin deacetylase (PgdA/CDA1 family)